MIHMILDILIIIYIISKEVDNIKAIFNKFSDFVIDNRIIRLIKKEYEYRDSSLYCESEEEQEEWNNLCRQAVFSEVLPVDNEIESLFAEENEEQFIDVSYDNISIEVEPKPCAVNKMLGSAKTDSEILLEAIESGIGNTELYQTLLKFCSTELSA